MDKGNVIELDRALSKKIGIELSLDDLRIIVGCFNAVEYCSEVYDGDELDQDCKKLKSRLEGLYRDELEGEDGFGLSTSCIGA